MSLSTCEVMSNTHISKLQNIQNTALHIVLTVHKTQTPTSTILHVHVNIHNKTSMLSMGTHLKLLTTQLKQLTKT